MTSARLLLFDIDGTLIHTRGGVNAFLRGVREALPELADDLGWLNFNGATDTGIVREIFRRNGREHNPDLTEAILRAYLRLLPEELGRGQNRLLAGAAEILEAVAGRPDVFKPALLTGNVRRGAEIKLGHFDLWRYFPIGAFADDHHLRDELGPVALERAAAHFGQVFPPETVWVIGDTPRDIACARAIGARVLAVASGNYTREQLASHAPDVLFDGLSDVEAVLEVLRG